MGGTSQNISSEIKAPDEIINQYRNVFDAANAAAAKPFQMYSENPADFVAQINAQQKMGISGINAAAGSYQPFYDQAMKAAMAGTGYVTPGMASPEALDIQTYMNPYQQDVINSTMALMGQANEQAQSGALGTATSSGAFGGDRAGIAAANLSQQQNLAMGSTLAEMNAANYNQALAAAQQQQGVQLAADQANVDRQMAADQANLERQLQAAATMGNLGTGYQSAGLAGAEAQINAGTLQQQTEQAGLTALYNQFMQQQAYPFQTAQFLADIAGAIGPNYGSTTEQREVTGSARGGRIGKADGGITSGMPYSSMFPPVQNAGAYVPPTGYVPVGGLAPAQMMVPDIVVAEGPNTASDISSMATAFSTLQGMGTTGAPNARGGRIYRADGGAAYLNAPKPTGVVPPAGYMGPVEAEADKAKDKPQMPTAQIQQGGSSGLGDFAKILATVAQIAALNRGGRVGYADGGVPIESEAERLRRLQLVPPQSGLGVEPLPPPAPGSATDKLPSGLVPQPDRISAPVSYAVEPPSWTEAIGATGQPYEYDTRYGLVRDPISGRAITNERTADRIDLGSTSYLGPVSTFDMRDVALTDIENQMRTDRLRREDDLKAAQRALDDVMVTDPDYTGDARSAFPEKARRIDEARAGLAAARAVPFPNAVSPQLPSREVLSGVGYDIGQMDPALAAAVARSAPKVLVPAAVSDEASASEAASYPTISGIRPDVPVGSMPAAGLAPQASIRPQARPDAPAGVAGGVDPREFYRTKILGVESGHRQFDESGNPLQSPAGAIGIGQIMPSTGPEAARLAGLEWDENRFRTDEKYNAALGEAYFLEQYRKYGTLDAAAAAYNAGPRAYESAKDASLVNGGSYLDYLPLETQAYIRKINGMEPAPAPVALAGANMATMEPKAYEDRNFLGKLAYTEDGKLNPNFLMSILAGLGTAAVSPAKSKLGAFAQGLGSFANAYTGLQRQAADIDLTRAQAYRERIAADVGRFFTTGDKGIPLVLVNGGTVTLADYLKNPQAFSTGDRAVDAQILSEARKRAATMPPPEGVRWTESSNDAVTSANEALRTQGGLMNYGENASIVNAMSVDASNAAASAAAAKPNTNELGHVVADAIGNNMMGTAQSRDAVIDQVLSPINSILQTFGYSAEALKDPETAKQLLDKLSMLNSKEMTPDQYRAVSALEEFRKINPSLQMTADAAAQITAAMALSQQADIDRADYYSAFQSRADAGFQPNYMVQGFNKEYGRLHQREKDDYARLLQLAADKEKGQIVMDFMSAVNSGTISPEDAQATLRYLLGDGVSPIFFRWFVKEM